jgi:hypothetical protein
VIAAQSAKLREFAHNGCQFETAVNTVQFLADIRVPKENYNAFGNKHAKRMIQILSLSRITFDCFLRYPEKCENDFVRVAQNRFHKKSSIPLCRRLKQLFINWEGTTELKVKSVEGVRPRN